MSGEAVHGCVQEKWIGEISKTVEDLGTDAGHTKDVLFGDNGEKPGVVRKQDATKVALEKIDAKLKWHGRILSGVAAIMLLHSLGVPTEIAWNIVRAWAAKL